MKLTARSTTTATLGATALLAIGTALAPEASAAEVWTFNYSVKAATTVAKLDTTSTTTGTATSRLTLGANTLESDLRLGEFRAPVRLFGLQVGTAVIRQEPLGPATGTLHDGVIRQTSKVNFHIVSISPLGKGYLNLVGGNCRTATPVTINVSGKVTNIFEPVTLSGGYTIPNFSNCGLLTSLVNKQVSGPGNTLRLELTPV